MKSFATISHAIAMPIMTALLAATVWSQSLGPPTGGPSSKPSTSGLTASSEPPIGPTQPNGHVASTSRSSTGPSAAPSGLLFLAFPWGDKLLWDNGLAYRANDDWLKVRLGGKAMYDFGWINGHSLGQQIGDNLDDNSQWRRLRPYLAGNVGDAMEFKIEAEFTQPQVAFKDVYVRLKGPPEVGDLTIGHFQEPFGLEMLTSSTNTTFIERALPSMLDQGRNFGAAMNNTALDERMTWAAGIFQAVSDDQWGSTKQGNAEAVTGRMTCLPMYQNQGEDLVHLGGEYSFRLPQDPIKFTQRPEAHFVPNFTDTGFIDADNVHLLRAETAWVRGPFSLQGEYSGAAVDADSGGFWLDGAYVQASYFLTGEHRPYDKRSGAFTGVKPKRDFLSKGGGLGAWEIASRYSFLDVEKPPLPPSDRNMQDVTLGLNWYLNQNMRMSWNYVRSWVHGSDASGAADIFLMGLEVSF